VHTDVAAAVAAGAHGAQLRRRPRGDIVVALIGGSLALALRDRHEVTGYDNDERARAAAKADGIRIATRLDELMSADAVLGLILGGAVGNAFDRVINGGGVTDFINFHFWPVFNVADSAVSIGVALLIVGYVIRKPNAA